MNLRSSLHFIWNGDYGRHLYIRCKNCDYTLRRYVRYIGEEKEEEEKILQRLQDNVNFNYCNNCGWKLK